MGEPARFRRIAPVVVLAAAAAGLTAVQPAPAHAATATALPITSAYQLVADTAHGHLFISQGPTTADAPVVVTNLSATPLTTIGKGARGPALSADDKTLYAAIGDTVTAFSTTTLKQTASYPTPGPAWQVAQQSGRLWVSYQDGSLGEVGGIDPGDPTAPLDSVPGEWLDIPPAIAVDPNDSGILVTSGQPLTSAEGTATYNVSDPSAVTLIDSTTSFNCGISDLAVLPHGQTFLCDDSLYSTETLAPSSAGGYVLSLYPFERVPADLTLTSTASTIAYGGSLTVTRTWASPTATGPTRST